MTECEKEFQKWLDEKTDSGCLRRELLDKHERAVARAAWSAAWHTRTVLHGLIPHPQNTLILTRGKATSPEGETQ